MKLAGVKTLISMLGGNTAGARSGLKVTLFNIAGYAVPGLLLSIDQIAYECCSFDSRGPYEVEERDVPFARPAGMELEVVLWRLGAGHGTPDGGAGLALATLASGRACRLSAPHSLILDFAS